MGEAREHRHCAHCEPHSNRAMNRAFNARSYSFDYLLQRPVALLDVTADVTNRSSK